MSALFAQGIVWYGRSSELDLLSKIFDLEAMPSQYEKNAYSEIQRHRVSFPDDWPDDWLCGYPERPLDLFRVEDEEFLKFLNITIEPTVRSSPEVAELVELYNSYLRADGYEFQVVRQISGRPVYEARPFAVVGSPALDQLRALSPELVRQKHLSDLHDQIRRLTKAVKSDPAGAVGDSKDLLEAVAKTILVAEGVQYKKGEQLQTLFKKVRELLSLMPDGSEDPQPGNKALDQLIGNLNGVVQNLSTLRNHYGTGHGQPFGSGALESRHARLSAGCAATLATFLLETHVDTTTGDNG